ncbi:unnamed protein product, partial [Mesorhabditis spiculigera]
MEKSNNSTSDSMGTAGVTVSPRRRKTSRAGSSPAPRTALSATTPRKSNRSARRSRGKRGTRVHFTRLEEHPWRARVQLVLCNISDRPLRFELKANSECITASPISSGHIGPRTQARVFLTWELRAHNEDKALPDPKILLITEFPEYQQQTSLSQTTTSRRTLTQLLCLMNDGAVCWGGNPPVEQFLFDAMGLTEAPKSPMPPVAQGPTPTTRESLTKFLEQLKPEVAVALLLLTAYILFAILRQILFPPQRERGG